MLLTSRVDAAGNSATVSLLCVVEERHGVDAQREEEICCVGRLEVNNQRRNRSDRSLELNCDVAIQFERPVGSISSLIIDFETAYATDFFLALSVDSVPLFDNAKEADRSRVTSSVDTASKQHRIVTITFTEPIVFKVPADEIVLVIRKPATQWGSSIWRFALFGSFD